MNYPYANRVPQGNARKDASAPDPSAHRQIEDENIISGSGNPMKMKTIMLMTTLTDSVCRIDTGAHTGTGYMVRHEGGGYYGGGGRPGGGGGSRGVGSGGGESHEGGGYSRGRRGDRGGKVDYANRRRIAEAVSADSKPSDNGKILSSHRIASTSRVYSSVVPENVISARGGPIKMETLYLMTTLTDSVCRIDTGMRGGTGYMVG